MSNLIIINNSKPTLPTQTYCYSGIWDCQDPKHDCPGKCGHIKYKDENGNIIEKNGYCIEDTNIVIVASEIILVVGLALENCDQPI